MNKVQRIKKFARDSAFFKAEELIRNVEITVTFEGFELGVINRSKWVTPPVKLDYIYDCDWAYK